MNISHPLFLLRLTVAVMLLMHSVPGIFNNGINDFGNFYLNAQGFAPFGVPLAWAIKLSHIAAAISVMTGKYVRILGFITIGVLVMGIIMVHGKEGWFVVGGGKNGMEFNILLIAAIATTMYPDGWKKKSA